MRGVTTTMVDAFYAGKPKKMRNTEVAVQVKDSKTWIVMYLHGNAIAKRRLNGTALLLSAAGWSTNTTKERLNGIGGCYGVNIWQTDFEWYWSRVNRSTGIVEVKEGFDTSLGAWTVVYAGSPTEELYEEVVNGCR